MDEAFVKKITALRGEYWEKWIQISEIIKRYERQWGITCLPPFPLSYNYVHLRKLRMEIM